MCEHQVLRIFCEVSGDGGQPSLAFGRQNLISGSRSVCVCPQYVGAVLRDAPCPSMGVCRQGGGCGFGMLDGEIWDGAGAQQGRPYCQLEPRFLWLEKPAQGSSPKCPCSETQRRRADPPDNVIFQAGDI